MGYTTFSDKPINHPAIKGYPIHARTGMLCCRPSVWNAKASELGDVMTILKGEMTRLYPFNHYILGKNFYQS